MARIGGTGCLRALQGDRIAHIELTWFEAVTGDVSRGDTERAGEGMVPSQRRRPLESWGHALMGSVGQDPRNVPQAQPRRSWRNTPPAAWHTPRRGQGVPPCPFVAGRLPTLRYGPLRVARALRANLIEGPPRRLGPTSGHPSEPFMSSLCCGLEGVGKGWPPKRRPLLRRRAVECRR